MQRGTQRTKSFRSLSFFFVKGALKCPPGGGGEIPACADTVCVTWYSFHGHQPPPTSSGHLLTHQPRTSPTKENKPQRPFPLGHVRPALPHSSPACRLRKCPSRVPATRGRVMTRPRRTPGSPAHPRLREPGLESSPPPGAQAPPGCRREGPSRLTPGPGSA